MASESLLMHAQLTTFLVPHSQWGLGQASADRNDRNGHLLMLLEHQRLEPGSTSKVCQGAWC